ncbi:MAG: hypothetical protein WC250_02245 [Candidatus Paceibacterota bacterium]
MREAFLFTKTDVVVAENCADQDLRRVIALAIDRTVIVKTPTVIGSATVIADKIITSLLLVRDCEMVRVRFYQGKSVPAFVVRRNPDLNLAELLPTDRSLEVPSARKPLVSTPNPDLGKFGAIGDPLLVVNTEAGTHSVRDAGALYSTRVSGRFEESWKIRPKAPRGLIGGGVWDLSGRFVGLAIGEKIQPDPATLRLGHSRFSELQGESDEGVKLDPADCPIPSVYALRAGSVLDFAESSN